MADLTAQEVENVMRHVLSALQTNPSHYRRFGVYWWPIKALLRRVYTRDNLYMLGTYEDQESAALVPKLNLRDMLAAALEEYGFNARFNMHSNQIEAPNGEMVTLFDPDVGL